MVTDSSLLVYFTGIAAIGLINEALDEGDPTKTLSMLQNPSAKLTDVDPSVAQHYHDKLLEARREKAHVSPHKLLPTWSLSPWNAAHSPPGSGKSRRIQTHHYQPHGKSLEWSDSILSTNLPRPARDHSQ